ncbi:hypothetical protein [Nocardia amikacinitolerans]|uniref:hypothetical protein n=1 Tax=Nocardia amikacinitolerans TaxID=756689 RepID=UPI00157BD167|nr:hypothetical protein [Nocardia amikacinitolerans]
MAFWIGMTSIGVTRVTIEESGNHNNSNELLPQAISSRHEGPATGVAGLASTAANGDRAGGPSVFAAGDTAHSRCEYYRAVCNLPAVVDEETGRIGFTTGMVWAIRMPADLGLRVKGGMERRQCGGGSIISHPRSRTWTFLVRSDIPVDLPGEALLWRNHVHVIRGGGHIALPGPSDHGLRYRTWITLAHSGFRPSGLAVIDTVHACLASPGSR